MSLKDIFNNDIQYDQGKINVENFTQENLYQKDQYSVPIHQNLYKTNSKRYNVSSPFELVLLVKNFTDNNTTLSTRLQDSTSTSTIVPPSNEMKHIPANHNQTNEYNFKEISADEIPHHQRPLALVKSWATK